MKLDLHVHTTASDGSRSPEEVVEAALVARLDVIAITDHDTTVGVTGATEVARDRPIQVIPGIEVSSTHEGREIHVLGYFVDPSAASLVEHQTKGRQVRADRMRAMIARLADQGVRVDADAVLEKAGSSWTTVGRPHLARALVEAGHASSNADAFDRLIGDRHPAFLPASLASPWEAVRIILDADGLPVWAHPPADLLETLLPRFVQSGLRGIEVYRPRNHPDQVLRLERRAQVHGLFMSGGSDWHGPEGGTELGDFFVNADEVADLIEAGGL
jgi:predicted metal-dependent phosphoesterase TrpH